MNFSTLRPKLMKNQEGFVLWFTGLSGAGKSTLADALYEKLKSDGMKVERLDGDIVRENLTKGLGFSKEDRDENIRRIAFVAKLLSRNGIGVVASFISPYEKERQYVREQVTNFMEVHVNTPLEICESRDSKGLYAKARRGEIKNFTGVSDPYEKPKCPEIEVCGDLEERIDEIVGKIFSEVKKKVVF